MELESSGPEDPVSLSVTKTDQQRIRETVGIIAAGDAHGVADVAAAPLPSRSHAFTQFRELQELVGEDTLNMFTVSHSTVHLAILAGVDHMKGFAAGVGRPGTAVSVATLTRGAVEAFGKAFYILSADTGAALIQRHTAVLEIELKHSPLKFHDPRGRTIEAGEFLAELRARLEQINVPPLKTGRDGLNITNLARQVLDASAELEPQMARNIYAQLSAIAHGNTAALAMHLQSPTGPPSLHLPRDLTYEHAGMNIGTCVTAMDTYLAVYGADSSILGRWDQAKRLAQSPLTQLQEAQELGTNG